MVYLALALLANGTELALTEALRPSLEVAMNYQGLTALHHELEESPKDPNHRTARVLIYRGAFLALTPCRLAANLAGPCLLPRLQP